MKLLLVGLAGRSECGRRSIWHPGRPGRGQRTQSIKRWGRPPPGRPTNLHHGRAVNGSGVCLQKIGCHSFPGCGSGRVFKKGARRYLPCARELDSAPARSTSSPRGGNELGFHGGESSSNQPAILLFDTSPFPHSDPTNIRPAVFYKKTANRFSFLNQIWVRGRGSPFYPETSTNGGTSKQEPSGWQKNYAKAGG